MIKKRQQTIAEARARLDAALEKAYPGIMAQKGLGKPIDLTKIAEGDTVYIKKLDQTGVVTEVQGKELTVQVGGLHTKVKASGCTFIRRAAESDQRSASGGKRQTASFLQKTKETHREIDIRGMMVDEAEVTLGKFLDDAVIAGLSQVLIIHGKGTGALRKGVQEYLKHHRSVLRYAFADMTDGGTGATVVDLK